MPPTVSRALLSAVPATPPTEFRLFKRGENPTSKGVFLFDDAAAKSVMTAFREQGNALPIDLNHESLDNATRPDSADARGWFSLALRNGELWAVNVTWTPDGAARLANRTQRFISPAFTHDADGRVLQVVNCALCAAPATHNAPALVAASRYGVHNSKPLSVRVTRAQLHKVERVAQRRRITVADVLRLGIDQIARGKTPSKDPESIVADIARILDLPATASPADVLAAIKEIVVSLQALPSFEPSAETAQPVPPPPGTASAALSKHELDACRKHRISPADYLKYRKPNRQAVERVTRPAPPDSVAALSKRELDACRAQKLDPAEYIARKANAARRV